MTLKPAKRKQRRNAFGQFAKKRTVKPKVPFVSVRWEPMQALVQQPIKRTLWQRICGYFRGGRA